MTRDIAAGRPRYSWLIGSGLVLVLMLSGCSYFSTKTVDEAAQNPVAPIVLKIVHGGLVAVAANVESPETAAIAELGVVATNQLEKFVNTQQKKAKDAATSTLLMIEQTIVGKNKTSVFRIKTGHKLQLAMNGQFIETIEQKKITIKALPNTDSTIVVTDATAGQVTDRHDTVGISPDSLYYDALNDGDHSRVDLDTGANSGLGNKGTADLYLTSTDAGGFPVAMKLSTADGAKVALWNGSDTPAMTTCASLPDDQWKTVIGSGLPNSVESDLAKIWCVRTSSGLYGTLTGASGGFFRTEALSLDYVLWAKAAATK